MHILEKLKESLDCIKQGALTWNLTKKGYINQDSLNVIKEYTQQHCEPSKG